MKPSDLDYAKLMTHYLEAMRGLEEAQHRYYQNIVGIEPSDVRQVTTTLCDDMIAVLVKFKERVNEA